MGENFLLLLLLLSVCYYGNTESKSNNIKSSIQTDPNGYIIFCLCMGRFGNQVEHFLGGLEFAKKINRTLILPPWRTYKNIDFNEWFQIDPLSNYHKVILAKDFMVNLGEEVWPKEKRYGFCYQTNNQPIGCQIKTGEPFTNFWNDMNVDFIDIVSHSISYHQPQLWMTTFSPSTYPVLALKGAPASFPMQYEHRFLQRFLRFSDSIRDEADNLLTKAFGNARKDYVAIHLRNGPDWHRACQLVPDCESFMSDYQCLPVKLTKSMCLPHEDAILTLTKTVIGWENATKLLIATDGHSYLAEFTAMLGARVQACAFCDLPVIDSCHFLVVHIDPWLPVIDIYLLCHSRHFIGNCASSFSAFIWRHRLSHDLGRSSHFGLNSDLDGA